jgi:nitrogen fixation protein FixH
MSTAVASRGRYIPWIFVAGFAVVFAVNAVMVWYAISSFSGLYTDHAREIGIHYNDVIAEQRERDALGWKVGTAWRPDTRRLELSVAGPDGQPLVGAHVRIELVRPAEKGAPLPVAMAVVGMGAFAGYVDLPERGNWDLDIKIESGGHQYAVTRRMFLK